MWVIPKYLIKTTILNLGDRIFKTKLMILQYFALHSLLNKVRRTALRHSLRECILLDKESATCTWVFFLSNPSAFSNGNGDRDLTTNFLTKYLGNCTEGLYFLCLIVWVFTRQNLEYILHNAVDFLQQQVLFAQ